MNSKHTLLVMIMGIALSGCAAKPSPHQVVAPPSSAELCCQQASQYPYVQLKDNEEIKFDVDSASPVGKFADGNSYFAAFKLSDRSAETLVTLSSFMVDDSVFAPQIVVLNNDFEVVRRVKLDDFKTLASDAFTRTRYITKLKINAQQTPYFIVYTPANKLGQQITVDHPAKVRAKEFGEVMPMVTDPTYTYQLGGHLALEVETLKLRPFKSLPKAVVQPKVQPAKVISAQPDTQKYYFDSIKQAVKSGDLDKALSLLEEAKALNIKGAQQVFIKAVNAK